MSTQSPVQWQTGLWSGGKAVERGVNHAHPYSSEVKESVQLNLYSTSACSRVNFIRMMSGFVSVSKSSTYAVICMASHTVSPFSAVLAVYH